MARDAPRRQDGTLRLVADESRRSAAAREAILAACLRLISSYDRKLSIEALAREAGVGKQTIYRWWPSVGAVLLEALTSDREHHVVEVHQSGSFAGDLEAMVRGVATDMAQESNAAAFSAVFGQMQRDDQLRAAFNAAVFEPIRALHRRRIQEARAAGEVVTDASDDDLLDLAFGPLWFRLLTRPESLGPEFGSTIARLVASAVRPAQAPTVAEPGPPGPVRRRRGPS
jgi:AcrR family transcriptional regulator